MEKKTLIPVKLVYEKKSGELCFEVVEQNNPKEALFIKIDDFDSQIIRNCLGSIIKEFLDTGHIERKRFPKNEILFNSIFIIEKTEEGINRKMRSVIEHGDIHEFYNIAVDAILACIAKLKKIKTWHDFIDFLEKHAQRMEESILMQHNNNNFLTEYKQKPKKIKDFFKSFGGAFKKDIVILPVKINCYDTTLNKLILENTLRFNEDKNFSSNDCLAVITANLLKSQDRDTITDWTEIFPTQNKNNPYIAFGRSQNQINTLGYKKYLDEIGLFMVDLFLFIELLLLKHLNKG